MSSRSCCKCFVGAVALLLLLSPSGWCKPSPLVRKRVRRAVAPAAGPSTTGIPDGAEIPPGVIVVPPPVINAPEAAAADASATLPPTEPAQPDAVGPGTAVTPITTPPQTEPSLLPAVAAVPAATCGTYYTEINLRPLRQMWYSGNGYCGESSVQHAALTRGIWISQKVARQLGVPSNSYHPDLLFDGRTATSGVFAVAKMLGLYQPPKSYWWKDNQTVSSRTLNPSPAAFMLWAKGQILLGNPVVAAFRIYGGGYYSPDDYDHMMPFFGVCYNDVATLGTNDQFTWTNDYTGAISRTVSTSGFYAAAGRCPFDDTQGGCIPTDDYDLGVAIGPLNAPVGLYLPVKLVVTGWSTGTAASSEPGERYATTATAAYTATVSGLTPNQTYRMYRTTGLFAGYQLPQSAAALSSACVSQGANCKSVFFTATAASMVFTDTSTGSVVGAPALGRFAATSVTYILVVQSAT